MDYNIKKEYKEIGHKIIINIEKNYVKSHLINILPILSWIGNLLIKKNMVGKLDVLV